MAHHQPESVTGPIKYYRYWSLEESHSLNLLLLGMKADHGSDCVDCVAFSFADSCAAADFPTVEQWIFWLSVATALIAMALPWMLCLCRRPASLPFC